MRLSVLDIFKKIFFIRRLTSYFSSSIGRKVLSIFTLISIVSIIIISVLSIIQLEAIFRQKSVVDYGKISEELYYNINRLIIKGKTDINIITHNPVIISSSFSPDAKLHELEMLHKTLKVYEDITIIAPSGLVIASTQYSYRGDWRYKKHFLECLKGKTVVSNVQAIRNPEKYIIDFTSPVFNDQGDVVSVIAAQLDMKNMSDIVTHVEIDKTGHAFLLNEHFKIIAHKDNDKIFLKPCQVLIDQIQIRSDFLNFSDSSGEKYIGVYFDRLKLNTDVHDQADNMDWTVVIVQKENEMFVPLKNITWKIVFYSLLICCVVIFLAILFSRSITNPIKQLTQGALALGRGHLDHRVEIETKDEIKQLARSFNIMAQNLYDSRERLKQREMDLNKAQSLAHMGSWEWNIEDNSFYLSDEMYNIFGIDDTSRYADIQDMMEKTIHPDDKASVYSQASDFIKAKTAKTLIYRIVRLDGETRWIEAMPPDVNRVTDDGKPLSLLGSIQDITKRKKTKEALQESEQQYRDLFDSISDLIMIHDLEGRFLSVNHATSKLTGYSIEEMVGLPLGDFIVPKFRSIFWDKYLKQIRKQGFSKGLVVFEAKDGAEFYVEYSTVLVEKEGREPFVSGMGRDITERKRMEKTKKRLETQLQQAQKMEAVGSLAGGIAHDFNNILGAILGYAELARLSSSANPKVQNYIDQLCLASERAKGLVQQILSFSRQSKSEKRPIDIGIVVKEALNLLRASIPSTIEIRQNVKSSLGIVEADPTQIHQIVMNLCTNAFHAMEEKGGQLDVHLALVEIATQDLPEYQGIQPGPFLRLTVVDTGEGMNEDTLSRIFEPYFTTKKVGKGSGMGLSVVHGIIKDHAGDIKAYSEQKTGTTFQILLPVIESKVEKTAKAQDSLSGGTEKILFVDDEEALVEIGKEMLESLGYKVEGRINAFDALHAFQAQPDQYDLIITDMTMPQMTGEVLCAEIRKLQPEIPVIICTGYSNRVASEKFMETGISSILMKPLNLSNLSRTVRKVLDDNNG